MLSQAIPFLHKLINPALAIGGLSKVDGRLGKFLSAATTIGYAGDQAIDFLRGQLSPSEEEDEETLRPDEKANKKLKEQRDVGGNVLKTAGSIAGAIGTGGALGLGILGAAQSLGGNKEEQQPQQPSPKQQAPQEAQDPRVAAYHRTQDLRKKKKILDELQADFEAQYGEKQQGLNPRQQQPIGLQGQETGQDPMQALLESIGQVKRRRGG